MPFRHICDTWPRWIKSCDVTCHWRHTNVQVFRIIGNLTLFNGLFRETAKESSKFCITGPLWGESTGDRWIPFTNSKLNSFYWSTYSGFTNIPILRYNRKNKRNKIGHVVRGNSFFLIPYIDFSGSYLSIRICEIDVWDTKMGMFLIYQ